MDAYELNGASREAWSTWLSAERWDVFLTLTDPGLSHPEHMYKRWRYFENSVNRQLYGNNFKRRGQGIETVVGLERQNRGSVHAHGLIRLPDHDVKDSRQFSWRYWQKFATELGGWAKLDIPRSNTDVVAYVTKYVCKDGDLILGPNFNPNRPRILEQSLLGAGHVH
jgi:hypothetical protein